MATVVEDSWSPYYRAPGTPPYSFVLVDILGGYVRFFSEFFWLGGSGPLAKLSMIRPDMRIDHCLKLITAWNMPLKAPVGRGGGVANYNTSRTSHSSFYTHVHTYLKHTPGACSSDVITHIQNMHNVRNPLRMPMMHWVVDWWPFRPPFGRWGSGIVPRKVNLKPNRSKGRSLLLGRCTTHQHTHGGHTSEALLPSQNPFQTYTHK